MEFKKKPQPQKFHSYRRGERQTGLIVFFVKKNFVQKIAWGSKKSHSRTISIPIAEANGRQEPGKGQSGMNQTEETDTTKHTTEWTQSTKKIYKTNVKIEKSGIVESGIVE